MDEAAATSRERDLCLALALPAQEKGSLHLPALPRRMWKGFSIGESIVHRPWSPQIIVTMPPQLQEIGRASCRERV